MSILSDILHPMMVIISGVLNVFVDATTGNTLTSSGVSFVGAMASLINHVTIFLAEFSALWPSGNVLD